MEIKELLEKAHFAAKSKGFWNAPPNIGEKLMLIVSELSEALEADRKSKNADILMFEIVERTGDDFYAAFSKHIKDTFEDEIADAVIRIFDLCGFCGIDIEKHIQLKMKFNSLRPYKHGKRY